MNDTKIFWFATITVFIALLLPTLIQDGMFLDGITYSAIAHNLANGIGSFWKPHYTKTLYPVFYEHPPLVFWLQSLFFRVLGESLYVERIYTFLTAVITSSGIILCWQLFFEKDNNLKKNSWIPVLLWISIPIIFWSYRNNMLENTQGVFTIYAVYFILRSLIKEKIIWLFIGSMLVAMAFFSKGLTGLFPLFTPILYYLSFRSHKPAKAFTYFLIPLLASVFIFAAILYSFPESKINLISYFNQQVIASINNKREVATSGRFLILEALITQLILPISLILFFFFKRSLNNGRVSPIMKKTSLFFFLVGISASIPLIISPKQSQYYLVPSIPFYILSASVLIAPLIIPILSSLSGTFKGWILKISCGFFIFIIFLSLSRIGKFSRDEQKLSDVYTISNHLPQGTILSTTPDINQDWGLIAYMCRIGNLSLDCSSKNEYCLVKKEEKPDSLFTGKYTELNLKLIQYRIYKKKIDNHKKINKLKDSVN